MHELLPDGLNRQLADFEARLRRSQTITAICGGAAILGAAVLAVFVSDRVWNTPGLIRAILLALAWGAVIAMGWTWVRAWILHRRSLRDLASLVQSRYRELGDRLLGAVELAEQSDDQNAKDGISPRLRAAAIAQVAQAAEAYDFNDAVDRRPQKRSVLGISLVALLLLVAVGLAPAAFGNAVSRWLTPWSGTARYTFAALEPLADELIVPHGEDFDFTVAAADASRWTPSHATLHVGDQVPIRQSLTDGAASFRVPGQTAPVTMRVRYGDSSEALQVRPVHRPILSAITAFVEYPEHLQLEPLPVELRNGAITVPAGSLVRFEGQANRPLAAMALTMTGDAEPPAVSLDGANFRIAAHPASAWRETTISWTDTYGLTPLAPLTVRVLETPDQPPQVSFPDQPPATAILIDETLEIPVLATDDFGLRSLTVRWEVRDRDKRDQPGERRERVITKGDPQTPELRGEFILAPTLMNIPPRSIIKLVATSRDYHPEHAPAESREHTIYILDHAEHARLLQQQFDRMRARLEDVTRQEENMLAEKTQFLNQSPEEMTSDASTAQLERQAREQESQTRKLDELAREGNDLVEEALRNDAIPREQLQQWSELMQQIQQIAQQSMPQVTQNMQQASQSQNAESRQQDVSEAAQQESEIIEQLRQMQQDADDSMQQMMARNFHMRLKELANRQGAIGASAGQLLAAYVGMEAAQLPSSVRSQLQDTIDEQAAIRNDAKLLQKELASFFTRTRLEKYDDVAQEMVASKYEVGLQMIEQELSANRSSMTRKRASQWQDRFNGWAEMLAPPQQDGGGSGGGAGGGGGMSPEQMQLMLALMKVLQEQEDVRTLTRMLNKHQDEIEDYPTRARELASRQGGLAEVITRLYEQVDPQSQKIFDQAGFAMHEATSLLRNLSTGEKTVAAQNEAVELLVAGMQSSAENMGQNSAAAMAMLQQMMQEKMQAGMGQGQSPGAGSYGGGAADMAGVGEGAGSGVGAEASDGPDRASGGSLEHVPIEFREAMEAYYRQVDEP